MNPLKSLLLNDSVELFPTISIPDIATAKLELSCNRMCADDGFYLCDLGEVFLQHNTWREVFPAIQPYYAVRCNSDEILLKWLVAMGVGFNCSNQPEMKRVLDLGASADKIILGNPCKMPADTRFAAENRIKLVSFDNEAELKKMKKIYPDAELLLCIAVDDSSASNKYGASIKDGEKLISLAVELELNVVGISFNNGNEMDNDANVYIEAFKRARSLFDFSQSIDVKLSVLDICGDFPTTGNNKQTFHEVSKVIKEQIEKQFPSSQFDDLRVIAEPGSFYVESAFTVCTNIIAKKVDLISEKSGFKTGGKSGKNQNGFTYYIGEGFYGCFHRLFALTKQHVYKPFPLKKCQPQQYPTTIWGPTCATTDKLCDMAYLPEMDTGDWLIWKDMGAYSTVGASHFNGFRTNCVHYFISENNWLEWKNMYLV